MQHSEFKNLHKIKTVMHASGRFEYEIDIFRELITDDIYGDYKILISCGGHGVGNSYEIVAETVFDAVQSTSMPQDEFIGEMLDIIKFDIDRNLEGKFR